MAMVNMNNLLNGKDSRWLQLEVCREFQRNKCSRPDTECKFAHPPANVEVQNGRVTAFVSTRALVMPRQCCVLGCKINYCSELKSTSYRSVFRFPKKEELRSKWLASISRTN
nr:unnamed protein product [Callosobruchus analis]